jgi:hypothetical protein
VVRRHELSDQTWVEIVPLLPTNGRPGGQWATTVRFSMGSCGSWPRGALAGPARTLRPLALL